MSRALYRISLTKPAVRHELGPLFFVTAVAATPIPGLWIPVNLVAFNPAAVERLLALSPHAEFDMLASARVDAFACADGAERTAIELTVLFICEQDDADAWARDDAFEAIEDERPTLH